MDGDNDKHRESVEGLCGVERQNYLGRHAFWRKMAAKDHQGDEGEQANRNYIQKVWKQRELEGNGVALLPKGV